MPSSIRRHHWSSASILRASVLDIAQQAEPYRNIGKIHLLYSFNFVEMASRDLQFSKERDIVCKIQISEGALAKRHTNRARFDRVVTYKKQRNKQYINKPGKVTVKIANGQSNVMNARLS